MPLTPWVCRNCGFWQRWFAEPPACPVCTDVRNDLPEDGWDFAPEAAIAAETRTTWRETIPGVYGFATEPVLGLGGTGWLVVREGGNVAYEGAGYYGPEAIAFVAALGGVRYASASHPHGVGAIWQLQDRFAPEFALAREGLGWSKALRVGLPYDGSLALAPGLELHHLAGHYEGHALLYDAERRAVFCGDAVKIERDERGEARGLSAHKAYHKEIPLTPAELARYREVFAACDFDHVFTTFDHAPLDRTQLLAFFDELARTRPTTAPRPLTTPARR